MSTALFRRDTGGNKQGAAVKNIGFRQTGT